MHEYHEILDLKGTKARLSYSTDSQFLFPAHWHDEVELFYVYKGFSRMHVSQNSYNLEPGDLLVIGSKAIHAICDEQINRKVMIQFHPSLFDSVLSDPDISKFLYGFYHSTKKYALNAPSLINLFESFKSYDYTQQSPLFIQSKILELTHYLYEAYKDVITPGRIIDNPIIQEVEQFVANYYGDCITLDMVADQVNLSKYYFTRYFKENKGTTFGQYLREYRIKKALNYLIETDLSVTAIAYTCGFESIKTFNRVFKCYTGLSPSQYRAILLDQ